SRQSAKAQALRGRFAQTGGGEQSRMMGQGPGGSVVHGEVERLKAREARLRQKRILLLRRELAKTREGVEALERELRLLGNRETGRSAGLIAWSEIYERLGKTFTPQELRALTVGRPRLPASIAVA